MIIARRKNMRDCNNYHDFLLSRNGVSSLPLESALAMWLASANDKLTILKHASAWRASVLATFGTFCHHVNETRLYCCMREGMWPSSPCYPAVIQSPSWNRSVELSRSWPHINEWGQLRLAENYLAESNPNLFSESRE